MSMQFAINYYVTEMWRRKHAFDISLILWSIRDNCVLTLSDETISIEFILSVENIQIGIRNE